jgi:hypothetical protein
MREGRSLPLFPPIGRASLGPFLRFLLIVRLFCIAFFIVTPSLRSGAKKSPLKSTGGDAFAGVCGDLSQPASALHHHCVTFGVTLSHLT